MSLYVKQIIQCIYLSSLLDNYSATGSNISANKHRVEQEDNLRQATGGQMTSHVSSTYTEVDIESYSEIIRSAVIQQPGAVSGVQQPPVALQWSDVSQLGVASGVDQPPVPLPWSDVSQQLGAVSGVEQRPVVLQWSDVSQPLGSGSGVDQPPAALQWSDVSQPLGSGSGVEQPPAALQWCVTSFDKYVYIYYWLEIQF